MSRLHLYAASIHLHGVEAMSPRTPEEYRERAIIYGILFALVALFWLCVDLGVWSWVR